MLVVRQITLRECCKCSSQPLGQTSLLIQSTDSWAPQTYDKLRTWIPEGDPALQKAWLSDYLPAVQ